MDEIPVEFPNDFEAYDPQLTDKSFTSKNGISGKRIFEHLLIPRFTGIYHPAKNMLQYKKVKTMKPYKLNLLILKSVRKDVEEVIGLQRNCKKAQIIVCMV